MKYTEVTPIHKKNGNNDKRKLSPDKYFANEYLPNIYERLMYNEFYPYFHKILSKITVLESFEKGFNAQALSFSNGREMAQNP